MLSSILHKYRQVIQDLVASTVSEGANTIDVKFVKPSSPRGEHLHANAINVAVFGSTAEKDLLGTYTFGTPTTGNNAVNQKPPLRVTLDTLLIFNLRRYETAIDCYGQVIGYFYNNDILTVLSDGYPNEVQVLLSSFDDRNEIEIWSSFNTPGILMLRYELKYALVTGKFEELPVIRGYSANAAPPTTPLVDALILNMIYVPVVEYMNQYILTATNTFCSVSLKDPDADALISVRYDALLVSYEETGEKIREFRESLRTSIQNGELDRSVYGPFMPSLDGILDLTKRYRTNLEQMAPADRERYEEICAVAKAQIEGAVGLPSVFMDKLVETSVYLQISATIDAGIDSFNEVGESTYEQVGSGGESFRQRPELSTLQVRQKWWELESDMSDLLSAYSEEIDSPLLDREGEVYRKFRQLLESCRARIIEPYEAFNALNAQYNKDGVEISDTVKAVYEQAYANCYQAINYKDNQEVSVLLAAGLQSIFIQQNIVT